MAATSSGDGSPIIPVDLTQVIRKRPWMYMRGDTKSPITFARAIAENAAMLGAGNARTFQSGQWGVVTSDVDWLGERATTMFQRLEPFPEGGANSVRAESITYGFAEALCYRRADGPIVWAKMADRVESPSDDVLALDGTFIAFRLP